MLVSASSSKRCSSFAAKLEGKELAWKQLNSQSPPNKTLLEMPPPSIHTWLNPCAIFTAPIQGHPFIPLLDIKMPKCISSTSCPHEDLGMLKQHEGHLFQNLLRYLESHPLSRQRSSWWYFSAPRKESTVPIDSKSPSYMRVSITENHLHLLRSHDSS